MITYVTVMVSSEGAKVSEVSKTLSELGFDTTLGNYDYTFDWGSEEVEKQRLLDFIDKVQDRLNGMQVNLYFSTMD